MSTYILPPTIALFSPWRGYYMNYTDDSNSSEYGFLRVNGSNVFSPLAKFEVLFANIGTGVHLRCRKNRKFLRRTTSTSMYISPDADKPEEDTSKWGCTLFVCEESDENSSNAPIFRHVSTGQRVSTDITGGVMTVKLVIPSLSNLLSTVFTITDLETVLVLPKYVAFKADNSKYLQVRDASEGWVSEFTSTDKGYSQCRYQTTTNGHGDVYLKSIHHNKYLRCEADASKHDIKADSDQPSQYGYFRPIKIDANMVALKNTHNQKFAKRFTDSLIDHQFCTVSTSMDSFAQLKMEEHVHNRRIYNTVFDLKNAIIYDETPKVMASASATNDSSAPDTVTLEFSYEQSLSSTWTKNHSWKVGVSVTVNLKVPLIGGTEVTTSGEYSGSYEWGETIATTKTLKATSTATVPPYSTVRVNLMATEGKCDVTYSYYQRDKLWDGNYETYLKDDGICKGMNSYNFHFEKTTVRNVDPRTRRAALSDSSVESPTTVEIIPLPELSDPTRVQHPVSTTTTEEQDLETPVQLTEWIVPAPPPETNQESGEAVA